MENFTEQFASFYSGEDAQAKCTEMLLGFAPAFTKVVAFSGKSIHDNARTLLRLFEKRNIFIKEFSSESEALHSELAGGGVRCLLALDGEGADLAKKCALIYGLPYILIAAGAINLRFFSQAYLDREDNFYILKPSSTPKAIFVIDGLMDLSDEALASMTGEIAGMLVKCFDLRVRSILFDGKSRDAEITHCEGIIARFISSISNGRLQDKAKLTLQAFTSLACALPLEDSLYQDSADQTVAALKMLFCHEERASKLDGENKYVVSDILLKAFEYFLSRLPAKTFTPPPDNNLRMEKIAEYFGMTEMNAQRFIKPYPQLLQKRLLSYKLAEYRDDFSHLLSLYIRLFKAADKPFRRIYKDGGFSYLQYLDSCDLSICMALAPDIGESKNFLTLLKYNGFLDKYIY